MTSMSKYTNEECSRMSEEFLYEEIKESNSLLRQKIENINKRNSKFFIII